MIKLARMGFTRRIGAQPARLPEAIARSLDESAEDLRQGRDEDSRAYLDRMQAKIDAYFAQKSDPAARPKR